MTEEAVPYAVTPPATLPPTDAKKAFLAALAKAQGEYLEVKRERAVKIVGKNANGDRVEYQFKYAELSVIFDAVRPALAKNGLSIRSKVLPSETQGHIWLQSILGHAEGYEDVSEMHVAVAGDLKTFGGQLTYIRRYLGAPQLGVASEDDIDNNGREAGDGPTDNGTPGGGTTTRAKPKPIAAAPAPKAAATPPAQAPQTDLSPDSAAPTTGNVATQEGVTGNVASTGPAPADNAAAEDAPTGEVITSGQAKWIMGKLQSAGDDAFVAKWLADCGVKKVELIPAESFAALRAQLMAL